MGHVTDAAREKVLRRRTEKERALFVAAGGTSAWQRELERRRAARNLRTRDRTAAAIEAKRQRQQSMLPFDDRREDDERGRAA